MEFEYDNIYIKELPANEDTNQLVRGSNLFRVQFNATPRNIINTGLLYNNYHSPYAGISALTPRSSTTNTDIIAWLPYIRDQHSFRNGALFDLGLGITRFRDGYEPHSGPPYALTPELSQGSYFETLTSRSQRVEANAIFYFPPQHWIGRHDLQAGLDLDRIGFDETYSRAPVNYLREDRTLLRQSTFPEFAPFTRHNVESGLYVQDRWTPFTGLLLEPGLRVDFDEIISSPVVSPRLAVVYSPRSALNTTKISAGVGIYYEHTQLEYLARALAGIRYDTYYAADGVTPTTPPLLTTFTYDDESLKEAHALNWSVGIEQRLPYALYVKANYIQKQVTHEFTYVNQSGPDALSGNYVLTNGREDYDSLLHRSAPHLLRQLHALRRLYPLPRAHQCSHRLLPFHLLARTAAERPPRMGHAQSRPLLGMASLLSAVVQKELGFRLHLRLAHRPPLHIGRRQPRSGGPRQRAALPRLRLVQPRPRMEIPLPRHVPRPARHS